MIAQEGRESQAPMSFGLKACPQWALIHCLQGDTVCNMIHEPRIPKDLALSARQATGLTQEAFAQLISVGRATVARWELGSPPPSGAALSLLLLIRAEPDLARQTLGSPSTPNAQKEAPMVQVLIPKKS